MRLKKCFGNIAQFQGMAEGFYEESSSIVINNSNTDIR